MRPHMTQTRLYKNNQNQNYSPREHEFSLTPSFSSILGSILSSSPKSSTFTFTFTVTSNVTNGSRCLPFNRPNKTKYITRTLQVPWDYHFILRSHGTINQQHSLLFTQVLHLPSYHKRVNGFLDQIPWGLAVFLTGRFFISIDIYLSLWL